MNIDLMLIHGTVITMDPERRIIEDGCVVVDSGRILEVGTATEIEPKYAPKKVLNCRNHLVLPGLIDAHGHAGHGMIKSLMMEQGSHWMPEVTRMYHNCTSDEFWYLEARLSALERLRAGITTGVNVIGSSPRSDTSIPGCNNARGYAEVGIRCIVCTGPTNPPWPHEFTRLINGSWVKKQVSYEEALEGAEGVIQTWNHGANDRVRAFVTPFVIVTSVYGSGPSAPDIAVALNSHDRLQNRKIRELAAKYNTRIHSDAFGGMIQMCHDDEYALLGPDVHLQHCRGISFLEAQILAETGTHVASSPAFSPVTSRCPVPELLAMGVKVAISTDGTSPAAPFDLFQAARKMKWVHQGLSHDGYYLPAGKLLEMITIDAAHVLGWDDDLGSLEQGKKADIITVDMKAPHLAPNFLPVQRLIFQAVGQDVDHVIVDGQLVLEDRVVKTVNEEESIEAAEAEALRTIINAGLEDKLKSPPILWGSPRIVL